ncbi:MAG: ABC transporter permease [Caulobacter sp.]|nr:ABC transporter permease [Vitreoscilla sp.]
MSNAIASWTVFVKELKDALRDRRTLMVVFFTSVAMGPLMLVLLSSLVGKYEKRAEAREIVAIGLDAAPTLRNYLERQTYVIKAAPENWESQLKDSKLGDPVVIVPNSFEDDLAHGQAPRIQLVYSSANGRAQAGVGAIERLLQGFDNEQAALRLVARGVAPGVMNVSSVDEHDIADNASRAAQLTAMVPMFVMMAVLYGALNAALDTTAGERERGSLEPLLATPATRTALVIGKWGAVFALGLLIAVLSCMSFLPAQRLLRSEQLAALFRFGWVEAAWFIGLLAPLAAALSALIMAIAIRCKTFKEAQANTVVLTLAVSMTPMVSLFNQEGESSWNLWVPALAQSTLMNRVLKNAPISAMDVAPSLVVCVVLTVAALMFVSRQLTKRAAQ